MKRSVIDITDLSKAEIDELMSTAEDIIDNPGKYAQMCRGKKLATLFFEASTRTRMSFEAAMYELGGNVLSMTDAATSSASKGESVSDTAKVISCYADIIAMRHSKEGAALVAANAASMSPIDLMPPPTVTGILTAAVTRASTSNSVRRPSTVAVMSRNPSSSAPDAS